MKKNLKNVLKKSLNITLIFCVAFSSIFPSSVKASESKQARVTSNAVRIRKSPTTKSDIIEEVDAGTYIVVLATDKVSGEGCDSGWYNINYNNNTGYICSKYVSFDLSDPYGRPWTSPKLAIVGGAKFITRTYIEKGQFTSYLKKFNVNPNGSYKVYNHQYMANLRAPYSESYTSFRSYRDNNLLTLPLDFTIPIFENMPNVTNLPGKESNTTCQADVTDVAFETLLDQEKFPESYKCKLRVIHSTYPNWTFKAMHTGLDFQKSVTAEQAVSSIQGGDIYYDMSTGSKVLTEPGWYKANKETVSYYLDPRNFLIPERILMFESLIYTENYTETVLASILKGTFMDGLSILDNQTYARIFAEAGKTANISSVYLASLAIQESSSSGSKATGGTEFTYGGTTYKGLYNFFNVGANSSAENPILAGLVWASGGSSTSIDPNLETPEVPETPELPTEENDLESKILTNLGVSKKDDCLVGFEVGSTIETLKNKLPDLTTTIENTSASDKLKTGQVVKISDGTSTYEYIITIVGDVDGDGSIGATDYVKIKNFIMEKKDSRLDKVQTIAADADGNGKIDATDYVKIKKNIME